MRSTKLTKTDGVVSMEKPFDYLCSLLPNGEYEVRIVKKTKTRTLPQNSLMWMWFKCLEEATGQDANDWHEYYKAKFLMRHVTLNGKVFAVPMSTTKLTTEQMSVYMDKIKLDALYEWDVHLPKDEDKYYENFVEDYRNR